MNEQPNRGFVCSVLFLDIVDYARRPVAEQMTLRQRFNALLDQALQRVAGRDRIVLDTADGAAISFLGNPEDTLFAAMSVRDAVSAEAAEMALAIRVGINLGPVRLVRDMKEQLNVIGDGIDVAQRVTNFAQPGQILVSRSYFEVVSRLSPELSPLFQFQGARTDMHVREHEVYAVGPTPDSVGPAAAAAGAIRIKPAAPVRKNAKLLILLPLGIAIIIAAGVALRIQRQAPEQKPDPQAVQQQPAAAPAATTSPAPVH